MSAKPGSEQPRVGRPPLTEVRREQILEAVEQCIVEYGLAATTIDRVAGTAGVSRTAVNHFVGTRDELIDTALARSVGRIREVFAAIAAEYPPEEQLDRFVDFVVGPDEDREHILVLVNEVITVAHRDETARSHLADMYADVEALVGGYIASRFPKARDDQIPQIAESIVILLREYDRIRYLRTARAPEDLPRRMRAAFDALIRGYGLS